MLLGSRRFVGLSLAVLASGIVASPACGQSEVDHRSAAACANPDVPTQDLPADVVTAFPNLRIPRPIIITDAGDGTNRLFIATQQGTVYFVPADDQEVEEPEVFLDLTKSVTYKDRENEEGFLGMAFHPDFKENGHVFIYYTSSETPHLSVVSRFTANEDKTHVDLDTEVRLLEVPQPAWNHNGGTVLFGPDGYLYIALGDGGAANDVFKNAQNLGTLPGSILRIDVDHTEGDLNYAIPKDNPFVDQEGARPEIYAYGLRNVWRMSFDSKTKKLWAADVGQDLWEEIDIIVKGGNYGWSQREAMHPFGRNGSEPSKEFIEPIWEYHHDIGKSITGGLVYRGQAIPELQGVYLFADYVTGKFWGVKYDEQKQQVVQHYTYQLDGNVPVITFGTDESGEVYFSDPSGHIFHLVPKK